MVRECVHPTSLMKHSKKGLGFSPCLVLAALFLLAAPAHTVAQDSSSNPPPAPPAQPKKPDPKPAKPAADSATQNAPDQPMWDPLRADKDMQVGIYYMHKGDLDAAIDRFQDAALAKPGYALPFLRLGEAQEKKGLKRQAIKSYQRYLDLYPQAGDKNKIQKQIDKLYKEVEKDKKSM